MKKNFFIFACLFTAGAALLTACSSDSSDDGLKPANLNTPAYKDVSACYEITSANSSYSSIELTESGNYVILTKSAYHAPAMIADTRHVSVAVSPWYNGVTRNTTAGNIITGKYTRNGDDTFVLEGFGTITITTTGDNVVSLEIAQTGATPYVLTAAKKTQMAGSDATNNLCRTWSVGSLRMTVSTTISDGKQSHKFSFDEKVNGGNVPELMYKFYYQLMKWALNVSNQSLSSAELDAYMAQQKEEIYASTPTVEGFLFSQTGTYLVTYGNSTLAIATWAWKDTAGKRLQYSWDYDNMTSSNVAGECDIQFSGSQCIITEDKNISGLENVENLTMKMIYKLDEVK